MLLLTVLKQKQYIDYNHMGPCSPQTREGLCIRKDRSSATAEQSKPKKSRRISFQIILQPRRGIPKTKSQPVVREQVIIQETERKAPTIAQPIDEQAKENGKMDRQFQVKLGDIQMTNSFMMDSEQELQISNIQKTNKNKFNFEVDCFPQSPNSIIKAPPNHYQAPPSDNLPKCTKKSSLTSQKTSSQPAYAII